MAAQRSGDENGKEPAQAQLSKREERQQRILDAAGDLLQKWGYRKTTLEDIAREARVAKGTIYLYWKTREELFMALINRESLKLLGEIAQQMAADPEGMTFIGIIKHSTLATLQNPLMKAIALGDTEFLSEMIIREYNRAAYQAQIQGYTALLELLRSHGLVRGDIDLREQIFTLISIAWGHLLTRPLLPDEFTFSDEKSVEIMTRTLKHVLEPEQPSGEEAHLEERRVIQAYFEQMQSQFPSG